MADCLKDELTKPRNDPEDACRQHLAGLVADGYRVSALADRGFGDQNMFAFCGSSASAT